jgi:hypothetical protein
MPRRGRKDPATTSAQKRPTTAATPRRKAKQRPRKTKAKESHQVHAALLSLGYGCESALHGNAFNPDTGEIAEYPELAQSTDGPLWQQSNIEEIARLAQGYKDIKGTNTMNFLAFDKIPKGKKATYLRIVAAYRPEKENPRRVRWTVGGDRIDYAGNVSTKTADLPTAKCLFNSVISTKKRQIHDNRPQGFLLGHTDGTVRIHADPVLGHS